MRISDTHFRTIWKTESATVRVIDQSRLPFEFATIDLETLDDAAQAIRHGGAWRAADRSNGGIWHGARRALEPLGLALEEAARILQATRPTAHNLAWALTRMRKVLAEVRADASEPSAAFREAACNLRCRRRAMPLHRRSRPGNHPRSSPKPRAESVNILTHCNAGWLACVDWGTALAPIYMAHDAGIAVHVWVDETRPRNQGAALTAFELGAHGVPHTVIADNLGGH